MLEVNSKFLERQSVNQSIERLRFLHSQIGNISEHEAFELYFKETSIASPLSLQTIKDLYEDVFKVWDYSLDKVWAYRANRSSTEEEDSPKRNYANSKLFWFDLLKTICINIRAIIAKRITKQLSRLVKMYYRLSSSAADIRTLYRNKVGFLFKSLSGCSEDDHIMISNRSLCYSSKIFDNEKRTINFGFKTYHIIA